MGLEVWRLIGNDFLYDVSIETSVQLTKTVFTMYVLSNNLVNSLLPDMQWLPKAQ